MKIFLLKILFCGLTAINIGAIIVIYNKILCGNFDIFNNILFIIFVQIIMAKFCFCFGEEK